MNVNSFYSFNKIKQSILQTWQKKSYLLHKSQKTRPIRIKREIQFATLSIWTKKNLLKDFFFNDYKLFKTPFTLKKLKKNNK